MPVFSSQTEINTIKRFINTPERSNQKYQQQKFQRSKPRCKSRFSNGNYGALNEQLNVCVFGLCQKGLKKNEYLALLEKSVVLNSQEHFLWKQMHESACLDDNSFFLYIESNLSSIGFVFFL